MKTQVRYIGMVIVILATFFAGVAPTWAATNQATDPGGGTITLASSGTVTVNSASMLLVKQVWTTAGTCLAGSPVDAICTAGTVTVPANTMLKFVIFVRNNTDVSLTNVRFQDILDVTAAGFTYVAGSIKWDASQADTATSTQIYTAVDAGTPESDLPDVGPGHYASISGLPFNDLVVGSFVAQQQLDIAARKTFALEFQATKK